MACVRTHQWTTQETESDFYVPNAIKDNSGSCYDYVFVSLGGNDQITTGCQEGRLDTVKNLIASVLNQVPSCHMVYVAIFVPPFPIPFVFDIYFLSRTLTLNNKIYK